MLAANGSILTILAISFERYYAICKPLKAGYKCTRLRATIIIYLIWLLACILTSPILIMAKSNQTTYIDGSIVYNCILETDTYWLRMYVIVSMIAFFCMPLLILAIVYWRISVRLIRENIDITKSSGSSASNDPNGTSVGAADKSSLWASSPGFRSTEHHGRSRTGGSGRAFARSFFSLLDGHGNFKHCRDHDRAGQAAKISANEELGTFKKMNSIVVSQPDECSATSTIPNSNTPCFKTMKVNKALSLDNHRPKRDRVQSDTDALNLSPIRTMILTAGDHQTGAARTCVGELTSEMVNGVPDANTATANGTESSRTNSLPTQLFAPNGIMSHLLNLRPICRFANGKEKRLFTSQQNDGQIDERVMKGPSSDNKMIGEHSQANGSTGQPVGCKYRSQLLSALSHPNGPSQEQTEVQVGPVGMGHETSRENSAFKTDHRMQDGSDNHHNDPELYESSEKCRALQAPSSRGELDGTRRRSLFGWLKGTSISSSTNSTYTNSTCLASELSSKSCSLHRRVSEQKSALSSESSQLARRGASSPHKFRSDRHSANQHDTAQDLQPDIDLMNDGSRLSTRASTNGATTSTNSSSVSCDADNTSEHSPSPVFSSNAHESSTKSYWLDSVSGPNGHLQHHHRLLQHAPVHQLGSQHEVDEVEEREAEEGFYEEEEEEQEEVGDENAVMERMRLGGVDAHVDEIDEKSPSNGNSHFEFAGTKSCVQTGNVDREPSYTAGKVVERDQRLGHCERRANRMMRSLTEDRQPLERSKLMAVQSAMAPLIDRFDRTSKSRCDRAREERNSIVGPQESRPSSRVRLINMAHNLSCNFHMKRTQRRSGSQPLVTSNLGQTVNVENDFRVVQSISRQQQMDSRRQVVAMLAFVVASFFLLFLPYRVFTLWLILSNEEQVQALGMEKYYNLTYFSRTLIYLHSALNPIVYNLISTRFRQAFITILCCRGAALRRRNYIVRQHPIIT